MKKLLLTLTVALICSTMYIGCSKTIETNLNSKSLKSSGAYDFESSGIIHNQALDRLANSTNVINLKRNATLKLFIDPDNSNTDQEIFVMNYLRNCQNRVDFEAHINSFSSEDVSKVHLLEMLSKSNSLNFFSEVTSIQNNVANNSNLSEIQKLNTINILSIAKHSYNYWKNVGETPTHFYNINAGGGFEPNWIHLLTPFLLDAFAYMDCKVNCKTEGYDTCMAGICENAAAYNSALYMPCLLVFPFEKD